MKKRILSFLIVICLLCSLFPNAALAVEEQYTYEIPGTNIVLTYTVNANGNVVIQGCNHEAEGLLNIPKKIDGHLVTQINRIYDANFSFSPNCMYINKIIIPDTVTLIGSCAFENCTSLSEIEIPSSVTSIGHEAFCGCESLTKISIPDSVTTIEDYTFSSCSSLEEIVIPNSITSIRYNAFSYCSALTKITIPNSVTSIGANAFVDCGSLAEIVIPNSITRIGSSTFEGCTSLAKVAIPDSVRDINGDAFSGCTNLSHITLGASLQHIYSDAFLDCPALKKVEIPKNVTKIDERAFGYITGPEKLNGFTISGYCGTTAETYATENGFTFERIHDPIDIEATLPTCTEPGLSGGTKCAGCGEILSTGTTVIPPTGHTPRTLWERDSSEHYHICSVCGERTDIANHTYGDWAIKQEPAATVTGWKEHTCTVCGYTQGESIPATGEVPPTPTPTATPTSSPSPTPTPTSSPSPTPTSTPTPSRPSGSSSSSSSRSDTYSITPPAASDHGTVTVSPKRAESGDKVTITVKPDGGCGLDTLVVKDRQGKDLKLTLQEDGTYTFIMPNGPVTINAQFFVLPVEEVMPPLPFVDVPDDADYRDSVVYVYENDLMNGTSENTFEPETETSRAMLVTILHRIEGKPTAKASSGFTDVPDSQWYSDAVSWAVEAGIITGFEDNTFRPEELVTKEHLITILYRYADYKGYDTAARESLEKYLDRDIVSPYAQDAMSWAEAEDLLNEDEARALTSGEKVRRRWVATMIMKFCENVIG